MASGIRALALFAVHDRLSSTQVATLLGVSRATAHRMLRALADAGFVSLRARGRGYVPGPMLGALGRGEPIEQARRERHRAIIADVRERTGESVHVSALVGGRVVVVDGRRSVHEVDIGLRIGMTAEAHAMAAGKVLLAALDDEHAVSLLPPEPFTRRGPATVRSMAQLRAELAVTRRRGWGAAVQESEAGLVSVAVPLDGAHWRDRTALVVSAPIERVDAGWAERTAAVARAAVRRGGVDGWALRQ